MHWVLWGLTLAIINIPILTLLADRMFGVPTPRVLRYVWSPAVIGLAGVLLVAKTSDPALLELLKWGVIGGFVASVALDIVRFFGHHVLRAFPVDMPQVFGMLALGLGPRLQEHMIAGLVARMAEAPPDVQRKMLEERLAALARLSEPLRVSVVRAMRKGLATVPEEKRIALMQTQLTALAGLQPATRRAVMQAMDLASTDGVAPVYAQPRGMPKIPMHVARELMARALPRAAAEAGVSRTAVILAGYGWHLLNGLGFGAAYTLLFGSGTWVLAFAWGIFIWAGMMIVMPVMMPTIKFPMPGFLIVPFVAHLVMAVPIGYYALQMSLAAAHASLFSLLLR